MVILNLAVTGEIMDDPEPTGCQYYARNLINGLAADGQTKVTVIGSDRSRSDIFPSQVELVVHKPIRVGGTAFFSSLINPPSGLDRFDLIHCPTVIAPFFFKPKTPVVITVHDLIPILYPQHNTWRRNFYFKRLLKHRFSRADGFITVSESTKQDLIRLFGVGVDRIETVYEGVDSAFRPGPVEREDFILSVGTQEPRKNVQGLIRSFVRIKESNPTLAVRLKIVGRLGWLYDDIVKLHQRYGDYIDFLGYVPQKQLIDLYRRAMFFVFPSFYEALVCRSLKPWLAAARWSVLIVHHCPRWAVEPVATLIPTIPIPWNKVCGRCCSIPVIETSCPPWAWRESGASPGRPARLEPRNFTAA